MQDKSSPFLDLLLHENFKIKAGGRTISYEVGAAPQFNFGADSLSSDCVEQNQTLRSQEVNEINGFLLAQFMKNLEEKIVAKKSSLNDKLDKTEIEQLIQEALAAQNAFNDKQLEAVQERLQHVMAVSEDDIKQLRNLYATAGARSMTAVRLLIVALLVQFAVLYYITYYVAGWDVGEPISYLIGVAVEVAGRLPSSSAGLLHPAQRKPVPQHPDEHAWQAPG